MVINDKSVLQFGAVLRKVRAQRGLSQEKLAFLSKLHVNTIRNLEGGKQFPTLVALFNLAKVLSLSPSDLVRYIEKGDIPQLDVVEEKAVS